MTRALVVDADLAGRNHVRMALERFGLSVKAIATPPDLGATFDPSVFDVVSVDAGAPGDAGELFAAELRASGWNGTLVLTTGSIGSWSLSWLKGALTPAAIFAKPLLREELELRLENLLPTLDDEEEDLAAWDGALKAERKRFAREIHDRSAALLDLLHEARRDPSPARLARASSVAATLAGDGDRNRFHALGEVCRGIAGLLAAIEDTADEESWRQIDTLADIVRGVPVDRVLAAHTIDDASVYRNATILLLVHPDLAVLLAAAEIAARHQVGLVTARTPAEAIRAVSQRRFDAALVAEDLDDLDDVLRALRASGRHGDLPVGLVGAAASADAGLLRVSTSLVRIGLPLREDDLVAAIGLLTRHRLERRLRAVVVDLEPRELAAVTEVLGARGIEVVVPDADVAPVAFLESARPDVVVADLLGGGLSGLELCRQVRSHPRLAGLPLVLVASEESDLTFAAVLRAGADDLLVRPLAPSRLAAVVQARADRWRSWAHVDPDLGVLRRSAFFDAVRRAAATVGGATRSIAVGLLDIRGLAHLVSLHGYDTGDRALELVARTAQAELGPQIDIARYAGDQLAVLLPGETTVEAGQRLERVVERVERQVLLASDGRNRVDLQVAWGVAGSDRYGAQVDRLLSAAERALRERKDAQDAVRDDLCRTVVG